MFKCAKNNTIKEWYKRSITTRRGFKTPTLVNAAYRKIEALVMNNKYDYDTSTNDNLTFYDVYQGRANCMVRCTITIAYTGLRKGKLATQPPKWLFYRTMDINNLVANTLKEYSHSTTNLVFPSEKGTWLNLGKLNNRLDSIIDQGSETFKTTYQLTSDDYYKTFVHRITPHGLRHTHAIWLFEKDNTITPKAVQERLGHKNISVTMDIYAHATSNQKDKLKSALDVDY
ncbi:hypothetical protein C0213_04045 [Latilactobacillus sakei]|nr:tyrosine-type recombinase/integrase [Latilactobacillus sakei]AUX11607.1 hypothetical protein C0213_04045 [Latilactobacillus sakei]